MTVRGYGVSGMVFMVWFLIMTTASVLRSDFPASFKVLLIGYALAAYCFCSVAFLAMAVTQNNRRLWGGQK